VRQADARASHHRNQLENCTDWLTLRSSILRCPMPFLSRAREVSQKTSLAGSLHRYGRGGKAAGGGLACYVDLLKPSSTGTPQPKTSRLVSLAMPTTASSSAHIASVMPFLRAAALWLAMQYSQPLVTLTAM
jgi:hypothetical protein